MTYKPYAGIGARKTPVPILEAMEHAGENLAKMGLTLRSGAAEGADTAFELGVSHVEGTKEIYLPWKKFRQRQSTYEYPSLEAHALGVKYHPNWRALSQGAQNLMARNSHQVLGWDLNSPALFVLCWTPGGKGGGGTGQAIRIAKAHNIPVIDLGAVSLNDAQNQIVQILEKE